MVGGRESDLPHVMLSLTFLDLGILFEFEFSKFSFILDIP